MILQKTDRQGFVTCAMVSGPLAEPYSNDHRDPQQIRYEGWLRSIIAEHEPIADTVHPRMGENSRLGLPWRVYYDMDSGFVDCSAFYSTMRRVRFDVAMCLAAPRDMEVRAVLWSWSAVDLYCNGERLARIASPVYKPIQSVKVTLPLKVGRNMLYLAGCNLGVRDTRSSLALQLLTGRDEVMQVFPDEENETEVLEAEAFLRGAHQTAEALCFDRPAPSSARLVYRRPRRDEDMEQADADLADLKAATRIGLPEGVTYVTLSVKAAGAVLTRTFERTEQLRPQYLTEAHGPEDSTQAILNRIAEVPTCPRGEGITFPMAPMLARKWLGRPLTRDREYFAYTLELLERRVDCADFMLCGVLRYIRMWGIPAGLEEQTRHALLNFRYWMDMDGFDGMCFWSENHALMFYTGAMMAGDMYPEETFPRYGHSGRELAAYGRSLVEQWLTDVEENGFEEFLSTVYANVTFAALMNLIDFGGKDISARASRVMDRLLRQIALHTYKDGVVAPMGRVYRSALHPFMAGALSLMCMADPTRPWSFGEGWLGYYAGSAYRLPADLKQLMDDPVSTRYTTGNARVVLEKNESWCLTSVESPRQEPGFTRWANETLLPDADQHTHSFTKSFNERFHGTTCFEPGVYGYQQHMWHAALDGAAAVFVNHPGSMSEQGDMRPGYWHGNGVMPAVTQKDGVLGAVYCIPENHPLHYTHLYAPLCRFDEHRFEDGWLFLRKGTGYLGIWCSGEMEAFEGMNVDCEWRTYGDSIAYLTVCGGPEDGSLEAFMARAKAEKPAFDGQSLTVATLTVRYEPHTDKTQYL